MAWTALNGGLSGTALNVNHIRLRPGSSRSGVINHELYASTDGGVYRKSPGTLEWAQLTLPDPSNAEFGDSPAATVDELTFHWMDYDPRILNTIFVIAAKDSVSRLWLYRSDDSGLTWSSRGVTTV
jgi:hypothetical protein